VESLRAAEPGAEGRLDTHTFTEGARAAYLHNPDTYAKDPCNNWSQNLSNTVAGKTIVAGGKHQDLGAAASAAIWVQCWRKDPWGVLRLASTADAMPVSAIRTGNPSRSSLPFRPIPISLSCVASSAARAAPGSTTCVSSKREPKRPLPPKRAASAPPPPSPARIKETSEAAAGLARETAAMAKAIESLRDANETLRRDLAQMREEVAALRERLVPREQTRPAAQEGRAAIGAARIRRGGARPVKPRCHSPADRRGHGRRIAWFGWAFVQISIDRPQEAGARQGRIAEGKTSQTQ